MNDKKENMIRVRLDNKQLKHLQNVKHITGMPISKIVRELIHNDMELSK